ncbi:MAG: sodium:proton exchanger [Alphaproteobacteria bacterium HGW-Alphaproteobacteria-2]|nr:MAG: sodium:proton exchanger [Alphaproteobacteria bacterium HGW-Alphaproteobacteria-2]
MFEVVAISFAFFFGLAVRQAGLPPLVGFLAAGFAINVFGPGLGLPQEAGEILHHVAHLGVLMLLFTVGLKLKLAQIVQPQVIGGALLHFTLSVAFFAPGLCWLAGVGWNTALLLAVALAFSSTVLAAKLLEARRELGVFHGRTAIGILILQDIIALVVMALWSGQTPNIWALLVFALPLVRPVLHRLLDAAGHDEILVLMGMMLSLVLGGMGFEAMGLSSEIGALVMGVMLSSHRRAKELAQALWALKEIFLVGFFLQIGMSGLPDAHALIFALALGVMLPLKGMLFFLLLVAFRLRARTAFLAALGLASYSEFGLIVAAVLLPEWLVPLAIAVSASFVVAAPLNRIAHRLFERWEERLQRFQRGRVHPDEQPKSLGDAQALIFGMGRTGTAAYRRLDESGLRVIGLDADNYKAAAHREAGRNVLFADAEDSNFWRGVDLSRIEAAVLAMDDIEAKLIAARMLRRRGFRGPIVAHALHEDHRESIAEAGATHTYLTMQQAGMGLADCTLSALTEQQKVEGGG